jgi:seryl-tRNA synthetase
MKICYKIPTSSEEKWNSKEINDLQNEIENVKEKNENVIRIIKEAISAMQTIVESLPNKNGEDKKNILMSLEDKMDNLHFFLNYFKDLSYRQWEGPILSKHSTNLGGVFLSGGEVEVLFNCVNCGKILRAGGVEVPVPNMHTDTVHDSRIFGESYVLTCDCGFEYEIEADSSYADWDIYFEGENQPEEFYYRILFDREIEANLNDILDDDE